MFESSIPDTNLSNKSDVLADVSGKRSQSYRKTAERTNNNFLSPYLYMIKFFYFLL